MSAPIIIDDLIDEVRAGINELGNDAIDDDRDILPALRRGQIAAVDKLGRHYPEPLLKVSTVTATTSEIGIPEDAYQGAVLMVERVYSGRYEALDRMGFRQACKLRSATSLVSLPCAYCVKGRVVELLPPLTTSMTLNLWYMVRPEDPVKSQGRITSIGSNLVTVDDAGADLTTVADELNNYVNIIDAQTGEVKCSLQLQSVNATTNQLTFKSSPTRTTVFNRTISTSIPSTVAEDDYVCTIHGSCVSFLQDQFANYMVQHAITAIKRSLDEPVADDQEQLKDIEQDVKRMGSGKDLALRVHHVPLRFQRRI